MYYLLHRLITLLFPRTNIASDRKVDKHTILSATAGFIAHSEFQGRTSTSCKKLNWQEHETIMVDESLILPITRPTGSQIDIQIVYVCKLCVYLNRGIHKKNAKKMGTQTRKYRIETLLELSERHMHMDRQIHRHRLAIYNKRCTHLNRQKTDLDYRIIFVWHF